MSQSKDFEATNKWLNLIVYGYAQGIPAKRLALTYLLYEVVVFDIIFAYKLYCMSSSTDPKTLIRQNTDWNRQSVIVAIKPKSTNIIINQNIFP